MNTRYARTLPAIALFLLAATIAFATTNPPTVLSGTTNPALHVIGRSDADAAALEGKRLVYVIPIREEIDQPMVYIVRRGIKEAIASKATILVLDMDTPGGYVRDVLKIMELLEQFKGETYTLVNKEAFSGGAFISAATKHIYMVPGSVIGAAAPIVAAPGGTPEKLPDTAETKFTSALAAKIRAAAQRNGHNETVFEAMVNKVKGLKVDGKEIIKEGDILTLTNVEAEKEYGSPPKKLLSDGTVENFDAFIRQIGYANAEMKRVEATGAERLAQWITAIAPILLLLGLLGIYIEFKLQTFGVIGVLAVLFLLIFFFGHYVAGLSGLEYLALFALGVILIALELFVFPGTAVLGIVGSFFIFVSLIMAMVDRMPDAPILPTMGDLRPALITFGIAMVAFFFCAAILSKYLPKTAFFNALVLHTASGGDITAPTPATSAKQLVGSTGTTTTPLRPAGKAMIDGQLMDVVTEGDHIPKDTPVKVIAVEGMRVVVMKA